MKKFIYALVCAVIMPVMADAVSQSPQQEYVRKYSVIAVSEMYRSGVPASITLAQGLLESGCGLSELALKSNNHFGIKCHNSWKGEKVYHDDDAKGECFRKYDSPEDSFRDHSDFLRYRDRYKFLFDYKTTDYEAWAYGLKTAGYATDPSYPSKLIRLIEEYDLHEYDTKPSSYGKPSRGKHVKMKGEAKEEIVTVPESPTVMEQSQPVVATKREQFSFILTRPMYVRNGVPFVTSVEGETCRSIAASQNLFLREILRFNDLDADVQLLPGTVVYVQAKKRHAAKGIDKYVAEGGETMREIAQRYAVKLSSLYRLNGVGPDYIPREGDVIKLRK